MCGILWGFIHHCDWCIYLGHQNDRLGGYFTMFHLEKHVIRLKQHHMWQ